LALVREPVLGLVAQEAAVLERVQVVAVAVELGQEQVEALPYPLAPLDLR
jgi:hypothetical protein